MIPQPNRYCYDATAKIQQSKSMRAFYRQAVKLLPTVTFKTHFNPGGIAVWGETYAKLYRDGLPIVEAYDTSMGLLVRQWNGRNSGRNHYVASVEEFAALVETLAAQPFVRF